MRRRFRSSVQQHGFGPWIVGVAGVAVALMLLLPIGLRSSTEPREIVLEARGMRFAHPGQTATNPTIRVRAGESIRLVVRNQDVGMRHDLAVPAWGAAIDPLPAGETGTLVVRVPSSPGRYLYRCRPHAALMVGFFEVIEPSRSW